LNAKNVINHKERSFSKKDKDIFEIEKKVDCLLQDNKNKLTKTNSYEIDLEKISLFDNNKKKIYYVKKKKIEPDKDYDKLSDKIISDARANLGEEPLIFDKRIEEKTEDDGSRDVFKKKIRFGKRRNEFDDEKIQNPERDSFDIISKNSRNETDSESVKKIPTPFKAKNPKIIDEDKEYSSKEDFLKDELSNTENTDDTNLKPRLFAKKKSFLSKQKAFDFDNTKRDEGNQNFDEDALPEKNDA